MSLIRFGDFVADPRTEELRRAGRKVRLPRQSFQVLVALTRAPGELVTREALQAELWPTHSEVEYEQGLNAAINRLREALGDSAATPLFIETLPRRGYRFIGQLEAGPEVAPTPAASPEAPAGLTTGRRRGPILAVLLGGFAVLLATALLLPRREGPVLRPGQLKPFTALPGEERAPSFAPDGSRIVFAWNGDADSGGGFDLYVKAMDSEQLLRLTHAPAQWLSPAWSPDGAAVAFTRRSDTGTGLFVVPAMGGAERRIASAAFVSDAFMQPAWSPDGGTLAYASYDASGTHVIRLANVATLAIEPLALPPDCWNAGLPAFSADGKRLAFVCTTSVGVFVVHVMDVASRKSTQISSFLGDPQGLIWGADGKSLILASDAGEGGALSRLGLDGTLNQFPFGEEGSAPTRAGNRVAYVRARQAIEIWRMDLAATDPAASAQRLIYSTRREMTPQYSADGQRIVFQSSRSGSSEIWMSEAQGANPVRLTQFNGPLSGAPQWCDDGKRVAFDSRVNGNLALFVVDVDERQPRKVPTNELALGLPVWSADCQWLLASDGRGSLYRLSATGGAATRFTTQTSYLAQVHGDRVIFNVKHPQGVTLWTRSLNDGEESALEGLPMIGYAEAWAVAPAGVYFTARTEGAPSLQFYAFETRAIHRVASLPKTPSPGGGLGIAVSRDGRWLLYTRSGEAESDIMLMKP
jgi:Tol biopolymer transport system component/DNA-binding winged helix-turn-helix (wHTH) protein